MWQTRLLEIWKVTQIHLLRQESVKKQFQLEGNQRSQTLSQTQFERKRPRLLQTFRPPAEAVGAVRVRRPPAINGGEKDGTRCGWATLWLHAGGGRGTWQMYGRVIHHFVSSHRLSVSPSSQISPIFIARLQ